MAVMSIEYAQKRIKELQQASEVRHLDPISIADLGGCFFTLGDVEEAYKYTKHASEIIKDAGVLMNLGLIYKEMGRHAESVHCIEEAYWLNPNDNYIRLGYAEGLLKAGFWKQAWPIYAHARPTQQGAHDDLRLPLEVVEWKEGPLPTGHRVIVINEGGTGDRFSYARWLPELTRRGIDWVFFPYDELFPFFERIIPRNKLVKNGDEIVATHWTTTFSLPAVLNAGPKEIPAPLSFVALPEKIEKYKFKRIDQYPAVGLCWSAAELFQGGRKVRSMTEGQAMRLVCSTADKVHFVNLQYGIKMSQPVINVRINDWEDTAGLIANLDGVISVDTGVMHLSGAMNKKMATLLSGNSCWKFLNHTKQCPWYPTATLFRNDGAGFESAIDKTISAIRNENFFPQTDFVPA